MFQKQTKSLYPSFMLHDLNAKELGLNQEQIEQFISQLDNTLQKIFNLYYKDGYNQIYIAQQLQFATHTIQTNLRKIKTLVKNFAPFWKNDITLILGRSGTGKSTLEQLLCQTYNVKAIKSYTTRPQRSQNEDNHIFITKDEINNYPNKIATTTINDNFYFATKEQLDESQIYVIDPNGLYELTSNFPNLQFNIIYLKLSNTQHQKYLKQRRKVSNETKDLQHQRLAYENQQFDDFEQKLEQNSLPSNINIMNPKDILPNYKQK